MKKLIIVALLFGFGFGQKGTAQTNMNFLGKLTYNLELSDIWGYVDSLGNEYALVGVNDGVSIVDVTDPANPNEVFFFAGASSTWRDIKTWNKHAYITNESNGGLFIIDLSNLPNTTPPATASYSGSNFQFNSAHNIYIDENGVAYIFGASYGVGGAILLDLTIDPLNPLELGVFDNNYLHDGMARGDTLWGGAVNDGFLMIIDVSNKANPQTLGTKNTPSNFTHNCWISDDGNTLFTTDEKSNAYVASYDVSNVTNITEIDRIRSNDGSGVIPHNTHFMNDYLITSYYRDGVTIHDVSRPNNMVEVGNYDTYTQGSGNGFNGAWGVYPWLPSGNIIVSDIENGLYVLGATYIRACYLKGLVSDLGTGSPIASASVEMLTSTALTNTDISGNYEFGISLAGSYQVVFSAPGYTNDTLPVTLTNGILSTLNAQLVSQTPFSIPGNVSETTSGSPISGANVRLENDNGSYDFITDGSGNFSITSIFEGNYTIVVGKWGYETKCYSQFIDSATSTISVSLDSGFYDDFSFDYGWTEFGTANAGKWERGIPFGTSYNGFDANPGEDVNSDCLGMAFVTGNSSLGGVGDDDVDGGNTILSSPIFDLGNYNDPYLSYYRWFFNDGGFSSPNDTFYVQIDNGNLTVTVETVSSIDPGNSNWVFNGIRIADFITPTANMQLLVITSDIQGGHLVEAGFDKFWITDNGLPPNASFLSDLNNICVPDSFGNNGIVQFTDNSIGGTAISWAFEGGNPAVSSSINPAVTYSIPGIYDVTMAVSNSSGTVTAVWDNYVTVYNTPISAFSLNSDTICVMGAAQFSNTSNIETNYYWDFGDGDTSIAQNPIHSYDSSGVFIVSLTTSNPACSTTTSMNIYVEVCSGIDQYKDEAVFNVFPNPFNNTVNFSYSLKEIHENAGLFVYDLTGRELLFIPIKKKEDNFWFGKNLPAGVYVIKLINGNTVPKAIRIIKL